MDIKKGDIFCATWGYEQTNVDFYRVTRVLKKMIELEEIGYQIVGEPTSWCSDRVKPDPEKVIGGKFKRMPKEYPSGAYVSINSVAVASKMADPEASVHRSWGH